MGVENSKPINFEKSVHLALNEQEISTLQSRKKNYSQLKWQQF
jgi:hypothetical protein